MNVATDNSDEADIDAERAIDALIGEFGGDPRAAIRALLHDIDILARDYGANVSRGFIRGNKEAWARTISVRRLKNDR